MARANAAEHRSGLETRRPWATSPPQLIALFAGRTGAPSERHANRMDKDALRACGPLVRARSLPHRFARSVQPSMTWPVSCHRPSTSCGWRRCALRAPPVSMMPSTTNVGSGGGGFGGGGRRLRRRRLKWLARRKENRPRQDRIVLLGCTSISCRRGHACRDLATSNFPRQWDRHSPGLLTRRSIRMRPDAASRQSSTAMPMIARGMRLTNDSMTTNRSIDVELRFDRRLLRGQNARRARRHAQERLPDEQVGLPALDRPQRRVDRSDRAG